jgi:hypothetical protein
MMGPKSNRPSQPSQLIPPAWPLQRWGMDLVGPLPTAQGNYKYAVVGPLPMAQRNYKYVVVAVEYFTKWIEAKPLVNIISEAVRKFFWQNIICRFGVPKELTVDTCSTQISSNNFSTVSARRTCSLSFITHNPMGCEKSK